MFSDKSFVLCLEGTQQSMLRVKPEKEIKHEVTEEKAAKQEVKVRAQEERNIKREIKQESQEEAVFDEHDERNIRLEEIAAHMAHLEMEKVFF